MAGDFVPLADFLRAPRGGDAPGAASSVAPAAGDRGTGDTGVDVGAHLHADVVAAVRHFFTLESQSAATGAAPGSEP